MDAAAPTLLAVPLHEEPPPLWAQVGAWIGPLGPITNGRLRETSALDTLAAFKQLRQWVGKGVLVALPAASRQQARYTKPELAGPPNQPAGTVTPAAMVSPKWMASRPPYT